MILLLILKYYYKYYYNSLLNIYSTLNHPLCGLRKVTRQEYSYPVAVEALS